MKSIYFIQRMNRAYINHKINGPTGKKTKCIIQYMAKNIDLCFYIK